MSKSINELKSELCSRLVKVIDEEIERFNGKNNTNFVSIGDSNYDTEYVIAEDDGDEDGFFTFGY